MENFGQIWVSQFRKIFKIYKEFSYTNKMRSNNSNSEQMFGSEDSIHLDLESYKNVPPKRSEVRNNKSQEANLSNH